MSNLSDVLGGIETVLEANVTGLKCYKYPPDAVNHSPAVLILPTDEAFEDPEQNFGGNSFKLTLILTVLVASGDPESGWTQLVEMLDPTEANKSIIKALRDNKTLDGKADTSGPIAVRTIGRRNYGEVSFFGADIILEAYKTVA